MATGDPVQSSDNVLRSTTMTVCNDCAQLTSGKCWRHGGVGMPLGPPPTITLNQGAMIERLIEASHLRRTPGGDCYFCGARLLGWCKRVRSVEVTDTTVNFVMKER